MSELDAEVVFECAVALEQATKCREFQVSSAAASEPRASGSGTSEAPAHSAENFKNQKGVETSSSGVHKEEEAAKAAPELAVAAA